MGITKSGKNPRTSTSSHYHPWPYVLTFGHSTYSRYLTYKYALLEVHLIWKTSMCKNLTKENGFKSIWSIWKALNSRNFTNFTKICQILYLQNSIDFFFYELQYPQSIRALGDLLDEWKNMFTCLYYPSHTPKV